MIGVWRRINRVSVFASQFFFTAATSLLLAALGLATGMLAARLLGPQGRGELAAIQMWPSLLGTFAMLGLAESLVYFAAREPADSGKYLGSAMAVGTMSSVVFAAAGYIAMPHLLWTQSAEVVAASRWYLVVIFLYALVGMPIQILRGRSDMFAWNVLRTMPGILWLFILVSAWFLGRAQPEVVAVWYLAGLAGLFLPVTYVLARRVEGPFRPEVRRWPPMLRYGLPSLFAGVPRTLNVRLDQMLTAALLPPQSLGLYAVAVAWGGITQPLLSAMGAVLCPRIASQGSAEQQRHAFAQGCRVGMFISLVLAVPSLLLTPWLLPLLFGGDFAPAVAASLVLVAAGTFAGLNLVLEEGLRGLGRPAAVMRAQLGGLAASALTLAVLLGPLGIVGAALASLLASGTIALIMLYEGHSLTGEPFSGMLFPRLDEIITGWERVKDMTKAAPRDTGEQTV